MTKIDPECPTIREGTATYKLTRAARSLSRCIPATSSYLFFRVKGMRHIRSMMSIDGTLQRALQNQAEADHAEARAEKPRKRQKLSLVKKS
jgi:hypothetical protein